LLRIALVIVVLVPMATSPVQAARVPTLEWGGSAHASSDTLAQWLDDRGAEYRVWAQRHPSASAWLEGKSFDVSGPRRTPTRVIASTATDEPNRMHFLVGVVVALGASLLVAASALSLTPLRARYGSRMPARQSALAAAGGGLIVSVAVGYGLTLF
jgi:hypothetical protein